MRIVTWNLRNGTGADVWPRLQKSLGAEVVLLQESRQPDWNGGVVWESVPHCDWGSAVLVSAGTIRKLVVEGYEGWVVGGEFLESGLNTGGRSLFVFSIHSPTSNAIDPRRDYVQEVVGIQEAIARLIPAEADLVLGGDFNFKSLGERKGGESMATTSAERNALNNFSKMGLASCWTMAHPGRALAQTLRWSRDQRHEKLTPYHCDGIFVPESWRPGIICEILTSSSFEVSDHYPVAAWISCSAST